ncbi:recombinase family protein [Sphingorhabdus sp.]|uniref:recombinase family protein n=1 Tax=Sphingorhabdus sp. TaxID=1902408 RepID=UPI00398332D7
MTGFAGKRAVIYARVSTSRQEDNAISLPNQEATCQKWITAQGAGHVQTFVEKGASATNDNRPEFQAMIAAATSTDKPFDLIVVHSLSRAFRNAFDYMKYRQRLKRAGVRLVSITQDFGEDPASEMALGILALFDEFQSAENGKHVRSNMLANAVQGHWNGQTPPFGYESTAVPQPKGKDRKKLEIEVHSAAIVRDIFALYIHGDAEGPMGVSRLAACLNKRGERLRGKPFHTSNVHHILKNTAYIGYVIYNRRDSKSGEDRPEDEWVPIPVPPIIDEDLFYAVQAQLKARDPKMGENADKHNSNLLTSLVTCGCGDDGCGGGLTTSTGKSGQYRYYACSRRQTQGVTQCLGRRVPMEKLDDVVVDALVKKVIEPKRLAALLSGWIEQNDKSRQARAADLARLRARRTHLEAERTNVIKLVRNGVCSPDDPQIASELGQLAAQRANIDQDIELTERQLDQKNTQVTPARIESFGRLLTQKLRSPDEKSFRHQYLRLLVDRVEVGDTQIRITGRKNNLLAAVSAEAAGLVPNTVRKWCTRSDSNARPSDS